MKKYIIITYDIHPIGGTQRCTVGKAKLLQENGWNVIVLFPGKNKGKCAISILDQFVEGGIIGLDMQPGSLIPPIRKKIFSKLLSIVGDEDCDEIIIESNADAFALWGELLAEKLNAKHMCFNCNELFRNKNKSYSENLDFFDFKHKRKELIGVSNDSLPNLFEGYKDVKSSERYIFKPIYYEPVQDINSEQVNNLNRGDWCICYIGRASKGYVYNITDGISKFAKRHTDKKISVVYVGDIKDREDYIVETFKNNTNIVLNALGDLTPIPRSLYSKLDVVIAGSGCALCSIYEGVPVIIPDAGNFLANGVYGYDTFDLFYHEDFVTQSGFDVTFERVLVEKKYDNVELKLPDKRNPNEEYENHFVQSKEYYTRIANIKKSKIIKQSIKYLIMKHCSCLIKMKRRYCK